MDERKEMGGEEKEEEKKRKRLGQGKVWHSHSAGLGRGNGQPRSHSTWMTQVIDTLRSSLTSRHGFTQQTRLLLRELFRAASEYDLTSSDSSVLLDMLKGQKKKNLTR